MEFQNLAMQSSYMSTHIPVYQPLISQGQTILSQQMTMGAANIGNMPRCQCWNPLDRNVLQRNRRILQEQSQEICTEPTCLPTGAWIFSDPPQQLSGTDGWAVGTLRDEVLSTTSRL